MSRRLLRAAGALVLAGLLLGPSAQAHTPAGARSRAPAIGHTTNEWLMMGRNCGASQTAM
ncbi:MAG TPA: hypothetical protein VHW64_04385 [Nocardioides sp.]|jgi:hypothetical protein|uniref:hypothetical protein n=1 Tax=Nocardioides sp. TaxID=35761 RepID=UPI002E36B0EA|nr:hypothetical protein [Nocardioides sp.]HEX3929915.1 hypothetical protein [Nocardioides sp.]